MFLLAIRVDLFFMEAIFRAVASGFEVVLRVKKRGSYSVLEIGN